ncbi:MAG: hypothetical protein V3T90_06895 [Anaerolineae bacterium]
MDVLPPEFLILVVAIVSALVGGLLTWTVSYISGGGKSKRQHRRLPAATAQGESEAPAPAGEQELLRVSRTKKGRLAVFVQGQRYRRLLEITEPQVGRETITALKAVLTFAEGWLSSTLQSPSQPAPRRSTVDEEAFLEQLRQSDLFSLDKPSGLRGRPGRRPSSPRQLEPLLTPADEINDLVQQRLREQPELARHSIRLTTGEDGGLCIHVGLQTFDAVNDIPDLQVRALIQDAIREWEAG